MFLHVSIKNIILYIDLLFYVYFIVPRIRRYIIIIVLFDGIFVRVFHLQYYYTLLSFWMYFHDVQNIK